VVLPTCRISGRGAGGIGPKGIIEGAHPGLVYVDNSTIKPATARLVAERWRKLEWPAWMRRSAGRHRRRNATLAIMVGGPAEALGR